MKKLFLLPLVASLLLASCTMFGKLGEVEYYEAVVDQINEVSGPIEESATLYNETVPDLVTEASEVDTTNMQTSYNEASAALNESEGLLSLESRNIEQENQVRTELQTYQSAASDYLKLYEQMLTYYGTGAFKEDLSKVKSLNTDLHTSYTTFIQAHNELVEVLESYVITTEEN